MVSQKHIDAANIIKNLMERGYSNDDAVKMALDTLKMQGSPVYMFDAGPIDEVIQGISKQFQPPGYWETLIESYLAKQGKPSKRKTLLIIGAIGIIAYWIKEKL